jgi:hypothetical protein
MVELQCRIEAFRIDSLVDRLMKDYPACDETDRWCVMRRWLAASGRVRWPLCKTAQIAVCQIATFVCHIRNMAESIVWNRKYGQPPPCENCGSLNVLPSLITEVVQYWRCFKCQRVWATPLPPRSDCLDSDTDSDSNPDSGAEA